MMRWFCSPVKPSSLQTSLLQRSVCSGPWQPVSSAQSWPLCYFPWQPFHKTAPDTFQLLSEEKTQDLTYLLAFNIIQMFKPNFVDFFQEWINSFHRVIILLLSWPFPSPFGKKLIDVLGRRPLSVASCPYWGTSSTGRQDQISNDSRERLMKGQISASLY